MNDIIKNIEAAQLKQEVSEFHVGDTVMIVTTHTGFNNILDILEA